MSSPLITPRERDRFRKVVLVMKSATLTGERVAARQAAKRMANQWGLTLDEAIRETHPEIYAHQKTRKEQQAETDSRQWAWAMAAARMMRQREAWERTQFYQAKAAARARGLDAHKRNKPDQSRPAARIFHRTYRQTQEDRFRLISGLLCDGVPPKRVSLIADVPLWEVARVFLLIRGKRKKTPTERAA